MVINVFFFFFPKGTELVFRSVWFILTFLVMQVISQHPSAVSLPVTPTDTASPNLPMHFPYAMFQFLLRSNILERVCVIT